MGSKLFGIPISKEVSKQLNFRKQLLNKKERSAEDLMVLSNKGAWVRITSGINVVPQEYQEDYNKLDDSNLDDKEKEEIISTLKSVGNEFAKNNILSGGTLYFKDSSTIGIREGFNTYQTSLDNGDGTYDQSPEYGFRPMPGIVDFKVASKSTYGSLKEIELTIMANSREQLDMLDKLYLRPGYDMLVEFGNSSYLDENGEHNINLEGVFNDFLKGTSPKEIDKKITETKKKSGYNYEGIVGKVTNFSWDYGSNGSYMCSLKLMSKGELIESLSSNSYATSDNKFKEISDKNNGSGPATIDTTDVISIMFNCFKFLNLENLRAFKKQFKDGDKLTVGRSAELKGETGSSDEETSGSKTYHWFMPLRDVLETLNQHFFYKSTDEETTISFSTDFKQAKYTTHKLHISSDPGICALPYKDNPAALNLYSMTKLDLYGGKEPTLFKDMYKLMSDKFGEDLEVNSPLAILINVDHILDLQKAFLEQKKKDLKTEQVIQTLIKKLLDDVSTALGGINQLDLHLDNENNQWIVVDRTLFGPSIDNQELDRIDIIGLKSSVTNFSLTSKISNAIATTLAIGASAAGHRQRKNETLLKYNEDLVNRYNFTPPKGSTIKIEDEMKELSEISYEVAAAYKAYLNFKTYSKSKFNSISIKYSNFSSNYSAMERRYQRIKKVATHFPGLLPIDLNLTMDGISGLKVGEAFTISPSAVPKRYEGKVGFVITTISHSINDSNRWETDISCRMFNLPAIAVPTQQEKELLANPPKRPAPPADLTGKNGWLTPSSHPWSAAFISYVSKKGYPNFPGRTSHTAYAQALRSDSNWEVLDARKTIPKVGDLVLKGRENNQIDFKDAKYKGSSHVDIVVSRVGRNKFKIIGGNVGNTVKKQTQSTSGNKYAAPWKIVLRPKTNAINIQAIVNACEEEWRFWHLTQAERNNQYTDKEQAANKEDARGDALLARLDSYWTEASKSWGGQITREA